MTEKVREAICARVVDDWRAIGRWWSMRMMALAAILQIIPAEAILSVYAMVPEDLQMLLPSRTLIVVSLTVAAMIARVWKQKPKGEADAE